MAYAIETSKLTKYYGKARGIVDVDIAVEEGETHALRGRRGHLDPRESKPNLVKGMKMLARAKCFVGQIR